MKLVIVVVEDADADSLIDDLHENQLKVTKLASTGGFLRQGNTTLLIGIDKEKLETVKQIIAERCRTRTRFITAGMGLAEQPEPFLAEPIEVPVGGAIVFVVDVEQFFKF